MSSPDFAKFYYAVNGYQPFPWQERLMARVLKEGWPDAIDVPTGCGKTSVLDVAVFALAMQADRPPLERSPLRIFFVVDRRLVVDDVSAHAFQLQRKLKAAELSDVRDRLLQFGSARPLDVAVMRGGMYRSDTWADAPNQPLICVSTVDQVGSRLLFRGYGLSDNARPVHAGLVGNDSLVIVDEAHLSGPFLDTLRAVRQYQDWRAVEDVPGLRLVEMSATRRLAADDKVEKLDESDYQNEELRRRIDAPKIAELRETGQLVSEAAATALRLARQDTGVVGVVLNTVAAARGAFEILKAKAPDQCILLTGRIRPYDRDKLIEEYGDRIKATRPIRDGKRLFVVATQTIEVGADLDFDALVTEAAPLDSLRQRFGRLNRLGKGPEARAAVLKPNRGKDSEAIYGAAVEAAWDWLVKHGGERIDFGVRSMQELYDSAGDESLLTSRKEAPVLLPAYVDAWAQTNPAPAVEPEVAPFLHGTDSQESADVQIVWRADLDDLGAPGMWADWIALAPPVSREALPLRIGAARQWLRHRSASVADVEGPSPAEDEDTGHERQFLIWRGPEKGKSEQLKLRPGDTVIVRSSEGGCDQFGWNPDSTEPVRDIGDLCANERVAQAGGRYRARIVPEVIFPHDPAGQEMVADYLLHWDESAFTAETRILEAAGYLGKPNRPKSYIGKCLLVESAWAPRPKGEEPAKPLAVAPDETDQEDVSASGTTCVTLRRHTAGVARKAQAFANRCGLNSRIAVAIEAAAWRHDEGKQDERFQYMLSPLPTDEPLAKNEVDRRVWKRRQGEAKFPQGARHEFASVVLAEKLASWPEGCDNDLVLHLIGTHHGYGRPLPPVWNDEGQRIRATIDGGTLEVENVHRIARVDSGWVDRYWMLTRKYGWWGLAYLETILRRADCVQSREEQEKCKASN